MNSCMDIRCLQVEGGCRPHVPDYRLSVSKWVVHPGQHRGGNRRFRGQRR